MKPILWLVAGISISLAAVSGQGQIEMYDYSGEISGQVNIGLNPGPGWAGNIETYFTTDSETLYYNPAGEIQAVGTLTLTGSSGSFIMESVLPFSSPVGSATLNVGNNGVLSFDTTFTPAVNGPLPPNYLGLFGGVLDIPVSGSGTYNGEAFQGSWDLELPMYINLENVSSNSLTFTQGATPGRPTGTGSIEGSVVVGDNLADGAGGDNEIEYNWDQVPNAATEVPYVPDQTSSLALSGLALLSLALFGRRLGASPGRL
jgi:hypothetical protein